jgi:hypothetical protein
MSSPKRYLWQVTGLTAAWFLAVAGTNVVVDPHGVFRLVELPALAPYKERLLDRTAKAEIARSGECDVLLVGDSRVWIGFNPLHPGLAGFGRVHNCAFTGSTVYEGARVLELARHTRPPRLVVWGFDPEIVPGLAEEHATTALPMTRLDPDLALWPYHRLHTIGISTLRESFCALVRAARHREAPWVRRGQALRWVRPGVDYTATFTWILAECFGDMAPLSAGEDTGVDRLVQLLERLQADGTRVVLFFPPMHATRHEILFRTENTRHRAETIARELVGRIDDLNARRSGRPAVELWDFRGFTAYHAEDLPPRDQRRPMRWHWEPLHFREELGDLVLSRMFGPGPTADGFGVRLTGANIQQHLADLARQRRRYLRNHPEQANILSAAERMVH